MCSCNNIFSFYHSKSIIYFIINCISLTLPGLQTGISVSVNFPVGGTRYHGYKSVKLFNFPDLFSIPNSYIHPLMVIIKSNLRNYLRKTIICFILKFVCKPKMQENQNFAFGPVVRKLLKKLRLKNRPELNQSRQGMKFKTLIFLAIILEFLQILVLC